ncbi:hypothetical protein APA_202 [Pseudanabaena sp. lw0831]|uniref:DUF29 family protein n=1 Tax=Pseudanabaena sp. lw0831 TaxID=1357935 RepID=UPI0019161B42|nr:DUF29 family protein [Pseudanabaena sp. lw0831]GBO52533.1 hypothetical protein APA_202 [Pseudanabaena sp. lw0831]
MTQTIARNTSLYDLDLNLWFETVIAQLKKGDLKSLDIENLIEELEGLAGRRRAEAQQQLAEQESQRANRLAERLRALGIGPEDV